MTDKANEDRQSPKALLEYAAFRIVRGLVRSLPLGVASRVGAASWRWLAPLNKRHGRAARQLRKAYPERDAAWRRRVLAGMWSNLGATFVEGFLLDRLLDAPDRFEIALSPEVEAILSESKRGVVLASLHTGNWEVAVWPLVRQGLAPAGIYRPARNPLVDRDIRALRGGLYPAGLLPKGSTAARSAMRIVAGGGLVSIMADLRERKGVAVQFFGRTAPSTPFPAMVARHTGAPLVAGRVVRTGAARFRIEAQAVPVSRTAARLEDIEATTRALHQVFEGWIREHPEQWMWGHRRWGDLALRSARRRQDSLS